MTCPHYLYLIFKLVFGHIQLYQDQAPEATMPLVPVVYNCP
jgi:hypothetical protein